MVGVGKLLKQAQKMQQKMEEAQASLSDEIESRGAVGRFDKNLRMGEFKDLKLDPEFLKEDPDFVVKQSFRQLWTHLQAKKKMMMR